MGHPDISRPRVHPLLAILFVCAFIMGTVLFGTDFEETASVGAEGLNCLKKCDFDALNLTLEMYNSSESAKYSHDSDNEEETYRPSFASLSLRTSRSGNTDKRRASKEKELLVPPPSLPPLIQALVGNLDEHTIQKKKVTQIIGSKTSILPGSIVRRRMKNYKEEWEEALRWISKWSQQEYNHGAEINDTKWEQQTRKQSSMGLQNNNSVKKCLEKCQRKYSLSLSDEIQYYHESKMNSPDIQISLLRTISIRYRTFLRVHLRLMRNIFGIVFSTVIALGVKNVADWWKLNRYTLSLQELLLEESKTKISSISQVGKSKKGKNKTLRHYKNARLCGRVQNSDKTEDDSVDSEDSEDDSIERLYILNSKNRSSPTKISDSKIVRSMSASSTNKQVAPKEKQPKEMRKMEREPGTKKSRGYKTPKRNHSEPRVRKYFTESEHDQFVSEMASYQSRQIKRILNDEILCERAGKLSHLLLSDLHKYYQSKDINSMPRKTQKRSPPGFVQDAETVLSKIPKQGKELLEENEVHLMLSNILDESDNDVDDDDANKTWVSSTSNSTKPDSITQPRSSRSVAIGDLLLGSLGREMNDSPRTLNPWRKEMTTVQGISNELMNQGPTPDLLRWGDADSTRIW